MNKASKILLLVVVILGAFLPMLCLSGCGGSSASLRAYVLINGQYKVVDNNGCVDGKPAISIEKSDLTGVNDVNAKLLSHVFLVYTPSPLDDKDEIYNAMANKPEWLNDTKVGYHSESLYDQKYFDDTKKATGQGKKEYYQYKWLVTGFSTADVVYNDEERKVTTLPTLTIHYNDATVKLRYEIKDIKEEN